MKPYEKDLEGILPEVSFGAETIHVYRAPELPGLQTGYSISATGEQLTGTGAGDWRKEWTVIGYAEYCGDPIFIDSSTSPFPVYTAIHGEGSWEPTQIACRLKPLAAHSLLWLTLPQDGNILWLSKAIRSRDLKKKRLWRAFNATIPVCTWSFGRTYCLENALKKQCGANTQRRRSS